MTTSRSPSAINLDEIERQIREASARPAGGPQHDDPLAELARIVGGEPVHRGAPPELPRVERGPQPSVAPQRTVVVPAPVRAAPLAAPAPVARPAAHAVAPPARPAPPTAPPPAPPVVRPPIQPSAPPAPATPAPVDDFDRLMQLADRPAATPRNVARATPAPPTDDLDEAMRSLDDLLRARSAALATQPPVPIKPQTPPKPDPYDDWTLRGDDAEPIRPHPAARSYPSEAQPESAYETQPELAYGAGPQPPGGYWDDAPADDEPPLEAAPVREDKPKRRPLILVAAVLGVAAIGVGGALSMRGSATKGAGGQPPTIVADKGPMKVAPSNPGGIEIPYQNTQVLERTSATPGQKLARVVNSEEQPLDLREAVRRETGAAPAEAGPRMVATIPVPASSMNIASDALPSAPPVNVTAEPRRVRTVAVRPPEATPSPPAPTPGAATPPPSSPAPLPALVAAPPLDPPLPPPLPPQIVLPPAPVAQPAAQAAVASPAPPKPSATPAPAPPKPSAAPAPAPAAAPETAAAPRQKIQGAMPVSRETTAAVRPAVPAVPAPPTPAASPRGGRAPTETLQAPLPITPPAQDQRGFFERFASTDPNPLGASTSPAPPETKPAERRGDNRGGFVVQLSSEGSDQEARAAIGRMQSRFSELSGQGSSVQKREVKGQMRYRVRFGDMSRAEAAALCGTLKGKGQDCIVQPN